MKNIKLIFTLIFSLFSVINFAQITATGAYLIGNSVEVGINVAGYEGTFGSPLVHARTTQTAAAVSFGFVANPQLNNWATFDGDFFTPGSSENGFGLEINGINYSNNASVSIFGDEPEPPQINGVLGNYIVNGDCISLEWNGTINNVGVKIIYRVVSTELFYTTEVVLTNNTGATLTDIYYYRNLDPDNNVSINLDYVTSNTVESQPLSTCARGLVSASQGVISGVPPSYIGLAAIGAKFRVCSGGFANRDASDIWDGTLFNTTVGASVIEDIAISLAYKTTLAAGASESFKFATILASSQVDEAFSTLYEFNYSGAVLGANSVCSPVFDETSVCGNQPLTIDLSGPNVNDYTWTWSPALGLNTTTGPTIQASPLTPTIYTATGVPLNSCSSLNVTKTITVNPGINIVFGNATTPCGGALLSTLPISDQNNLPNTTMTFHGSIPISSTDMSNVWPSNSIGLGDVVYVMIVNTVQNCFDVEQIILDFSAASTAGVDVTEVYCNTAGIINLNDLVPISVTNAGTWTEIVNSGQFNAATGNFDMTSLLPSSYVFNYTADGIGACPDDVAVYTINIVNNSNAGRDSIISFCPGSTSLLNLNNFLNGADLGGDWSEISPIPSTVFQAESGIISTNGLASGIYTFNYLLSGCNPDNAVITINIASLNAGLDSTFTVCNSSSAVLNGNDFLRNNDLGGNWFCSPASPTQFNAATGTLNVNGLVAGTYILQYSLPTTAGCLGDFANISIVIKNANNAGLDNAIAICLQNGSVLNLNASIVGSNGLGTWQETSSVLSNQFNLTSGILNAGNCLAGNYTFNYLIAGDQYCASDNAVFSVSLTAIPNINSLTNQSECGFYKLPLITGSNLSGNEAYFTLSGGLGTKFNGGDTIFTSQVLYLFDSTLSSTYCFDELMVSIIIKPVPNIVINTTISEGCTPVTFTLTNNLEGLVSNCIWLVNNEQQSNCSTATYTIANIGLFDVSLVTTTNEGCPVQITDTNFIEVFPNPEANFVLSPNNSDILNPLSEVINSSTGADSYFWNFGDETFSTEANLIHNFPSVPNSSYNVVLTAQTVNGCVDSTSQVFTVADVVLFYMPNTFTPNDDELNNVFLPIIGSGIELQSYKFEVFNRWGEVIFESRDLSIGWDATYNGVKVQDGSYIWIVSYKETTSDKRQSKTGSMSLVR